MPAMIADDYLDNSPITPDVTRKPPRLLRKPKLREKIACKQVQTRSTRSRRNIKVPLNYQDFVEPIMEEDNYKYTCKDCGKGYSNQRNLRRHRNQVHENKVKYFRCSVVEFEKTYFRREYLLLHLQSAHQISREEAKEQAKRASHETGNRNDVKSPRKKAKVLCNVHGPVVSPSEPSTLKQSENAASASEQDKYVDFIDLQADSSEFNPDVDRTCSQENIPETDKEDTFYEHDELLDSLAEISNDLDEQAMDTESFPGPSGLADRSTLRQYSPTKLQNSYQTVKNRGMAVHKAFVVYSVPLTTLRDRVDGRIHIDTVKSGPAPLFSQEEEAKLVDHVKMMAAYGYGYSRSETIMMASDFTVYLQKRPKEKPLTNQWYYNFMSRWSEEIKFVKPRALEASRAKSATKEKVESYF
ncbi:unnamed protein product [Mytilus coruscus]|uniref:C2H2-type domain-containing protein n=1 Tax=Mytilus coruscus TaxID=42192 RepID=A0A6J8B1M3_MYTCO|nr:unnamed protein product [Mytilus coruscus]